MIALISVHDKTGVKELALALAAPVVGSQRRPMIVVTVRP